MTNSKKFFAHWDDVHRITLKLLKEIPADRLDFKPAPSSMSLADLAVHIFHGEKVLAQTGVRGDITMEDFKTIPHPHPKTPQEIYDYAVQVHDETNRLLAHKSWEELNQPIKWPWGELTLFEHLHSAFEHHWHHRGQLYVYLRMVGVEKPPFVFGYAEVEAHA
jgi:uncharacterized damage-inducible protein DinB